MAYVFIMKYQAVFSVKKLKTFFGLIKLNLKN